VLQKEMRKAYTEFISTRFCKMDVLVKPKMQDKQPFEYAIIRFVPKVEQEEFLMLELYFIVNDKNFLE
jgi:hypothetical protein